jgi:hypothetical protein
MKPLEKQITKNGHVYHQIAASPEAYLYEQTDKSTGKTVGFEVFKHRENKAGEVYGKAIEAAVAFPGNEAFGTWAWSYRTFAAAYKKYEELQTDNNHVQHD